MSTSTTQFNAPATSPFLVNQAVGSASMVDRMVRDDLRRGEFSDMNARVERIQELVNEHVLEPAHERELLLLAAMLLEGGGATRGAYRIAGMLLADQERLADSFLSSLRRFRARLALNCGDVSGARAEVTLTERNVMETLRGLGEVTRTIDHDDLSKVTAATWLLSAEICLAEREFDKALQDLANARSCMASGRKSPDEGAMFELLSALVCVGMGDSGGAPALAYLYHLHVDLRSESPVEALVSARIAAAAGDMGHVIGVSESEAARWRQYGPDPEVVKHYLREGGNVPGPSALLEKLPAPHEMIAAMDAVLVESSSTAQAKVESAIVAEAKPLSLLPISFLFEFYRLEEVTGGLFDYNLKTGQLEVDWSVCDEKLLQDAIAAGAISELALRCKGGTIYLNNGSYVDACFASEDSDLQSMAVVDVIFEIFRISCAGLPGAGARQLSGGPESARMPEVINLRANKFNLDLTKRLDHLRSGKTEVEPEEELDLDAAFGGWGADSVLQPLLRDQEEILVAESGNDLSSTDETQTEELAHLVSLKQIGGLSNLLGVLEAEDLGGLEAAVIECLASLGLGQCRVEIVLTNQGEKFRECGLAAELCDVWGSYSAGALSMIVSFGKGLKVSCSELVDVVMKSAVQRLRVLPGRRLAEVVKTSGFIAEDPVTQTMLSTLRDLAQLDGSKQKLKHILLVGERGTGKELLARAVHSWSARAAESFRPVNVGSISKDLAVSEIFGSKKGAFTNADRDRDGHIQHAEGGTLFLDEIDEAGEGLQALLKRVVQFGTYNMVGSPDERTCDVRFVAATNRGFTDESFIKEDLRDRFLEVRVPALRDRKGDIRPLAEFFAREHKYQLPEPVLGYLCGFEWPGNVRQLQNVVERVCALAKSQDDITLENFEAAVKESGVNPAVFEMGDARFFPLVVGETLDDRLNTVSRQQIKYALTLFEGNRTHSGRFLGITRQHLRYRMKELDIVYDKRDLKSDKTVGSADAVEFGD
jgi:DNA-binding NtrC family response regulator